MIIILSERLIKFEDLTTRHADILISDGATVYRWGVGGLPAEGDLQAILGSREPQLLTEAIAGNAAIFTPKDEEIRQAPLTARQWFKDHPAAIDFIRLSPAEQETQIDAMTTAQLKTLLKYLTIAVAALVKREFIE